MQLPELLRGIFITVLVLLCTIAIGGQKNGMEAMSVDMLSELVVAPRSLNFLETCIFTQRILPLTLLNPKESSINFAVDVNHTVFSVYPGYNTIGAHSYLDIPIVFAPFAPGLHEGRLMLQTSVGMFVLLVDDHRRCFDCEGSVAVPLNGQGSSNPYRIRPLTGAAIAFSDTASTAIPLFIFNPHSGPCGAQARFWHHMVRLQNR